MTTRQELVTFFKDVLPVTDGGDFFVSQGKTTAQLGNKYQGPIQGFVKYLLAQTKFSDHHTYFSTASFPTGAPKRLEANVQHKKCFYIDVDWEGGSKKGYADKAEVATAIMRFSMHHKIMPNYWVLTGNGYHIYWVLDKPCTLADWKPIAEALKQSCKDFGLHADHGITGDPARILRVPSSTNFKDPANPKACDIKRTTGVPYTLVDLRSAFKVTNVAPINQALLAKFQGDADKLSNQDTSPKLFVEIIKDCAAAQQILADGGKANDEPTWLATLRLLNHCEDGEFFVHPVSKGHSDYDKVSTDRKWAYAKTMNAPATCESFTGCYPDACKACPLNGMGSTPLKLGNPNNKSQPVVTTTGAVQPVSILPHGYQYNNTNCTTSKTVVVDKDTNETDEVFCFQGQVHNIKLSSYMASNGSMDRCMSFAFKQKQKTYEIFLASEELIDQKAFSLAVSRGGVALPNAQQFKELLGLIMAWRTQLAEANLETEVPSTLGWIEGDAPAFLLGKKVYKANEPEDDIFIKHDEVVNSTIPKGNLNAWRKQVMHAINIDHVETNVFIAASFGSVLISRFGESGGMISGRSQDSGAGKTMALLLAGSVWGSPEDMVSSTSTINARMTRAGLLKNLPNLWDELRSNIDDSKASYSVTDMVYNVVHGKDKMRLNSKSEPQTVRHWRSLTLVTSNLGVRPHIEQADAGVTNAALKRLLEFDFRALGKPDPDFDSDKLYANYGVAGPIFVQWLVDNDAYVTNLCKATLKKLQASDSEPAKNRYLIAVAGAIIVGAILAKKAGVVDLDIPKVVEFTKRTYTAYAKDTSLNATTTITREEAAIEALGDYLSENNKKAAVMYVFPAQGVIIDPKVNNGNVKSEPLLGNESHAYGHATDDNEMRIPTGPFKKWAKLNQRNMYITVIERLTRDAKMPITLRAKAYFNKFTNSTQETGPKRVPCYIIKRGPETEHLFI